VESVQRSLRLVAKTCQRQLLLVRVGKRQRSDAGSFRFSRRQLLQQLRVMQQAKQLFHADGLCFRVTQSQAHQGQQQLMVRLRARWRIAPG